MKNTSDFAEFSESDALQKSDEIETRLRELHSSSDKQLMHLLNVYKQEGYLKKLTLADKVLTFYKVRGFMSSEQKSSVVNTLMALPELDDF